MKIKTLAKYCLFYTVVLVLWTFMSIVLLEFSAISVQVWQQKHNPLIQNFLEEGYLPSLQWGDGSTSSHLTSLSVGTRERVQVKTGEFHSNPDLEKLLLQGVVDIDQTPAIDEQRSQMFFTLSPVGRESFALLNGQVVIKIDKQYEVQESYGLLKAALTPLKQRIFKYMLKYSDSFENARSIMEETYKDSQIRHASVSVFGELNIPFTCVRAPANKVDEQCIYLFFQTHPEVLFQRAGTSTEGSRWLIPGFKLKSNFSNEGENFYTTNQHGFHDIPVDLDKSAKTYRIMCIGGSTTEEGPSVTQTYPRLLEEKLKKQFPERNIEVINAGTPANASFSHLLRFNEYIAFQPDMIVLHLGVNDTMFYYDMEDWVIPAQKLAFLSLFFSKACSSTIKQFSQAHYENMGCSLELFINMAAQRNIKVCLASMAFPQLKLLNKQEYQYLKFNANTTWESPLFHLPTYIDRIQASNDILFQISEKYGIPYLAIGENIHGGMNIFTDFCHMNLEGIQRKADVFYEQLLPLLQEEFEKH